MASSTTKTAPIKKPRKPHPDFPLTPHRNGQWCKKVRGRVHYFGTNAREALNEWRRVKDDLLAGESPKPKDGYTVADICNECLAYYAERRDDPQDKFTLRTWNDYKAAAESIVKAFGRNRKADAIKPVDFRKLRILLSKTKPKKDKDGKPVKGAEFVRPKTLEGRIACCKVIFNFANAGDYVDRPIKYGKYFKKPTVESIRRDRKNQEHAGQMDLQANQINDVLKLACPQLKAMILLATNCGIGNADLGRLTTGDIDLEGGWLDYPRWKTEVERRAKLWPETVEAIKAAIAERQQPNRHTPDDLIFVTRLGSSWHKAESTTNPISQAFRKLLKDAGHYTKGIGFYALRRTFETIGAETKDADAVNLSMGHADGSMAALYRQRLGDERLEAVAEHVRRWLFGNRGSDDGRDSNPQPPDR